jgi:Trk-type K+ transport system membrane component
MWIGGGAQSTAGGIKVNAFTVIVMNLRSILRGTNRVEIMGREVSSNSILRANATAITSLGTLFLFTFILTILEPDIPLLSLVFECFSAIGTVGSSLNTSTHLGSTSKLLVSLLMFLGRVGIIAVLLGIIKQKKNTKYRYPSEDIIIN